jgi:hypothetical protein
VVPGSPVLRPLVRLVTAHPDSTARSTQAELMVPVPPMNSARNDAMPHYRANRRRRGSGTGTQPRRELRLRMPARAEQRRGLPPHRASASPLSPAASARRSPPPPPPRRRPSTAVAPQLDTPRDEVVRRALAWSAEAGLSASPVAIVAALDAHNTFAEETFAELLAALGLTIESE